MAQKIGHRWRSSHAFIVATITVGFFSHLFLFGFIVPILPYMLEDRIGLDVEDTQTMISSLLAIHALISVIFSPIVGHYADKTSDRKGPLLLGLFGELVSTVIVAVTKVVPLLFIGRIGQAISGTILWVVGFATLADTVGAKQMGMTIGIATAAVSLGTSAGPMVAGVLLEKVGYWAAWASAIAVLLVDIVMRLAMIENPRYRAHAGRRPSEGATADSEQRPAMSSTSSATVVSTAPSATKGSTDERSPLLPRSSSRADNEQTGLHFYAYLFKQPRFTAAMGLYMVNSIVVASLDATLPLHVQAKFSWGSFLAGMMFLALQTPGIILSPFFGWLRDRIGTRYPTGIAFLLIAPDLCLMGMPGSSYAPWAQGDRGIAIYIFSVVMLGVLLSSLNGVGSIEGGLVVEENENRHPGIFGPNGGSSRVYSIVGVMWQSGLLLGPLISGSLRGTIGYAKMNLVLAVLCLCCSVTAFTLLGSTKSARQEIKEQEVEETRA